MNNSKELELAFLAFGYVLFTIIAIMILLWIYWRCIEKKKKEDPKRLTKGDEMRWQFKRK